MATKCKTCGGTYEKLQADGTEYFHACPPVWNSQAGKFEERADKRDENVPLKGGVKEGGALVKSAGKGTEAV